MPVAAPERTAALRVNALRDELFSQIRRSGRERLWHTPTIEQVARAAAVDEIVRNRMVLVLPSNSDVFPSSNGKPFAILGMTPEGESIEYVDTLTPSRGLGVTHTYSGMGDLLKEEAAVRFNRYAAILRGAGLVRIEPSYALIDRESFIDQVWGGSQ